MGKKYLDTKQNTIEASVLDVWTKSSEEQEAIRNAAEMFVKEKYDQAAIDAKTDAEMKAKGYTYRRGAARVKSPRSSSKRGRRRGNLHRFDSTNRASFVVRFQTNSLRSSQMTIILSIVSILVSSVQVSLARGKRWSRLLRRERACPYHQSNA